MNRPFAVAAAALFATLTACGPNGKLTGKVVVEGGQAGNILVRVLGPTSVGVVTSDSGEFSASGLADGTYQVLAEVPNTDVSTQRATVKVSQGNADTQPTLTFKASVGKISGKVVLTDAGDASGLTVTLSGTDSRGAQTDSAGAFEFGGLKAGAYLVTAAVPGSVEGQVSVSVMVPTAAALPDLTFSFTGTLTGNVKAGTANAPNATVNIPGTERFALTDANGNFTLRDVPTGEHTVMARLNTATATQTVTVVRGTNTPLAFTLTTALTGTVTGSVGFAGNIMETGITVSVAGTAYSTQVSATGEFSLTLPPGLWEVVADARNYPRKSVGMALVSPGVTTTLPTARMSLYKRLPFEDTITGGSGTAACEGDWVLIEAAVSGADQLHLVNTATLSRRLLAVGTFSGNGAIMSSKCKWAALRFGSFVVLHNVATGEQRALTGAGTELAFSPDEAFLFYYVSPTLHRYNVASGLDEVFPANTLVTVDAGRRYLVSSATVAPFNYQLITQTTNTAAFTNTQTVTAFGGAAMALTDCNAAIPSTCNLRTLGVSGTTVNTYATGSVVATSTLDTNNSVGEYFHVRTTAPASLLVRTSTGAGVAMPATTTWIRYSPNLSRVAYGAPNAAQVLREEPLPATGSSAPIATSSTSFNSSAAGYLSDTRFMVFDNGTPRRIDVKSGTAAIDTDVTASGSGPAALTGNCASWGKASTGKRLAVLGDGTDQLIDFAAGTFGTVRVTPSYLGVVPPTPAPAPKYCAVNIDLNTVFILDSVKNEVRKLNGFNGAGFLATLGYTGNIFIAFRSVSGEAGLFLPTVDQYLPIVEPGISGTGSAIQTNTAISLFGVETANPRNLMVARVAGLP